MLAAALVGALPGAPLFAQARTPLRTLDGHHFEVYSVAFSPDGKALATTCTDRTVRLLDAKDGRERAALPHGNVVVCVAFSPDGKLVASGTGATAPFGVKLWDLDGTSGRGSSEH